MLIEHLDGLQTLLVSNFEGKNGSRYKNMERYKKAEYLWNFSTKLQCQQFSCYV